MSLCAATAALCACGSEQPRGEPAPDAAGNGDAAAIDAAQAHPLDAFSAASKDAFHLVDDGQVADGRARVSYAPKVMYLDPLGARPNLGAVIIPASATRDRSYFLTGIFAWTVPGSADALAQLDREANAAHVAIVRADLGLPHVTCRAAGIVLEPSFPNRCDDEPRVISFGVIGWQASQPRTVAFDAVQAAIDRHLADGGPWDDLVAGDIAWHAPSGDVLHTRLEVSCIGQLFDASGDPAVKRFDSPACAARYTTP